MLCGNKSTIRASLFQRLRSSNGQMSVELAITIPVILAVMGILINTMGYMDVTARFDRLAAEAVRIEAVSPGYGAYDTRTREGRVRTLLQEQFTDEGGRVSIKVTAYSGPATGDYSEESSSGSLFSLIPQLETYECTLTYSPWGFKDSFFGIRFFEMTHTRSFTIDPYRPAVIA